MHVKIKKKLKMGSGDIVENIIQEDGRLTRVFKYKEWVEKESEQKELIFNFFLSFRHHLFKIIFCNNLGIENLCNIYYIYKERRTVCVYQNELNEKYVMNIHVVLYGVFVIYYRQKQISQKFISCISSNNTKAKKKLIVVVDGGGGEGYYMRII